MAHERRIKSGRRSRGNSRVRRRQQLNVIGQNVFRLAQFQIVRRAGLREQGGRDRGTTRRFPRWRQAGSAVSAAAPPPFGSLCS